MKLYRKRPVLVEAIRYTPHENCAEVAAFLGQKPPVISCGNGRTDMPWAFLAGGMYELAQPGDWIVRPEKGEPYVVGPEEFELEYEAVEEVPLGPGVAL